MTSVLIDLFYLGVLALVVAAAVYVYKTRGEDASQAGGKTAAGDTAAEPSHGEQTGKKA